MKKLILLICLLTGISGYSQPYQAVLGKDTTQWNYYTDFNSSTSISTAIFKAYGDTIINGLSYKILYDSYKKSTPVFKFYGFIREDSTTGKLWILYDNIECKVMDLSLSEGDTLLGYSLINENIFKITKDTIIDSRKTLFCDSRQLNLEGIGTSYVPYTFFPYTTAFGVNISYLLCYYKDGIEVYNNTNEQYYNCFMPFTSLQNVKDINSSKIFRFSENENTIKISSVDIQISTLDVFDLSGNQLIHKNVEDYYCIIETTNLFNGIYIIKINDTEIYKFLKN